MALGMELVERDRDLRRELGCPRETASIVHRRSAWRRTECRPENRAARAFPPGSAGGTRARLPADENPG